MHRLFHAIGRRAVWQSIGASVAEQLRRAVIGERSDDALDAVVIEPRILYSGTPLPVDFDGENPAVEDAMSRTVVTTLLKLT